MTVRDVAAYLKVDEKTVYRLTQHGQLPGFKVAGIWRFKRTDIDRWIEEQKARAGGTQPPGDASAITGTVNDALTTDPGDGSAASRAGTGQRRAATRRATAAGRRR